MEKPFCSKCGLYLASVKEVSLHEQMQKEQKTSPSDIPSEGRGVSKISLHNRRRGHIANVTDRYKGEREGQIFAKNSVT